jgi:DNA replication protein DnaC
MTAFLKIDTCKDCQNAKSWEWVPSTTLNSKRLAGTGVWRSQLIDGRCPDCIASADQKRQEERRDRVMKARLDQLLGGEKPYREFLFERYEVASGNQLAFERAKHFNPVTDSLYLWGPCGVGKTHLAYAAARLFYEKALSVRILPTAQLTRQVRMKEPAQEQAALDELVQAQVLVLDDLGSGPDTAFSRQLLQEILDRRNFSDLGGLLVTSKYSLDQLAAKLSDDSIPSRLGGMCQVVELRGNDRRLVRPG